MCKIENAAGGSKLHQTPGIELTFSRFYRLPPGFLYCLPVLQIASHFLTCLPILQIASHFFRYPPGSLELASGFVKFASGHYSIPPTY